MKNIIIIVVCLIVFGGGGFLLGKSQGNSQNNGQFTQFSNGQARTGNRQFTGTGTRANGFRPVNGQIINLDDKGFTVKMVDNTSKIVIFSDKMSIMKATSGTKADLKDGETVMVVGQQNSDGSITAENIQLNPQLRMQGNRPTNTPTQ